MASHFRTDPGSDVSPVYCSCPLTDWHQSVTEADHHLGGSYHRKINPSLDWIMIMLHFHVPGNHVFLFMWHCDIRELINRCFLAISECECVYECTDRSVSLRCSWFQGVCRKFSGGGQDVGEVFGVADLAGRQPLAYPLTSSLSYILHPPSRVPFGLESITRHCEVTSGKWRQRAPGKHRLDMLFFSTVT